MEALVLALSLSTLRLPASAQPSPPRTLVWVCSASGFVSGARTPHDAYVNAFLGCVTTACNARPRGAACYCAPACKHQ